MTRQMKQPRKAWFRARVAELEDELIVHDRAHMLALVDRVRICRDDADARVKVEAEDGWTALCYGVVIALVIGLIVGGIFI